MVVEGVGKEEDDVGGIGRGVVIEMIIRITKK